MIGMGVVRGHRSLIAWVALVALFGNVIAALFCPLPGKAHATDWPADLLGPLVICSQAHAGAADDGANPETPAKPCPICLTIGSLSHVIAPAPMATIEAPLAVGERVDVVPASAISASPHRAGLGSRGPPLSA
jgi:hypothetical protein